jgi:hypothetical protein
METIEIIDNLTEAPNYDLSFADDNYQRYFKYVIRVEGEIRKPIGICHKCKLGVPRTGSNTLNV